MFCRHKWLEQERVFVPGDPAKSPRGPVNAGNVLTHPHVGKTHITVCCVKCQEQKIMTSPGDVTRSHGSRVYKRTK